MSTRSGFVMRTFLPIGPLVVSRGFGALGEVLVEEEPDLFKTGPTQTTVKAVTKRAPCAVIVVESDDDDDTCG